MRKNLDGTASAATPRTATVTSVEGQATDATLADGATITVTVKATVEGDEGTVSVPVTLTKETDPYFSMENAAVIDDDNAATASNPGVEVTFYVSEPGSYTATAGEEDAEIAVTAATHTDNAEDDAWDQITPEYTVGKVDGVYSVGADNTVTHKAGGYPDTDGLDKATDYYIAIVKGDVTGVDLAGLQNVNGLAEFVGPTYTQKFTVTVEKDGLEGAFAFEFDSAAADKGVSDTTVVYKGQDTTDGAISVAVALGDEALTADDVTVAVKSAPAGAGVAVDTTSMALDGGKNAVGVKITPSVTDGKPQLITGDYVLTVFATAGGGYAGSVDVPFTVEKIDLSKAVATEPNVEGADGDSVANYTADEFEVDGVKLASEATYTDDTAKILAGNADGDDWAAINFSYTDKDGATTTPFSDMNALGSYTYQLAANADNPNVAGAGFPVVNRYETVVTFNYGDEALAGWAKDKAKVFYASKGEAFDPSELSCSEEGVDFSYKVYDAEGEEASSWSEPGLYKVVATAVKYADYSVGGSSEGWFQVKASDFNPANATAYASLDNKMLTEGKNEKNGVSYTGSAFVPTVVVKDGSKTVSEDNYAVAVAAKDGSAVESILEPGDYVITVTYANDEDGNHTDYFNVTVGKATILSAKATADFFATDGETAVVPTFYGYTKDGCKGLRFELSASDVSVVYYDAATGEAVKASELCEEGEYWAEITLLTTAKYLQGTAPANFTLTKTAVFHDVAADAWYAQAVYDANQLGYMDGVAEGIFAPERAMTRAEFAQVVYNMATNGEGGTTEPGVSYPTKYSDVPSDAWYAKAIEWASRYGIVNGTSETAFDPNGTVTREQVATMLYRYAGNGAQADLSALDAFVDGGQVSDWAAAAMAWAVEEGYMHGKSNDDLQPQETASRAEIAALAVRVQPEWL